MHAGRKGVVPGYTHSPVEIATRQNELSRYNQFRFLTIWLVKPPNQEFSYPITSYLPASPCRSLRVANSNFTIFGTVSWWPSTPLICLRVPASPSRHLRFRSSFRTKIVSTLYAATSICTRSPILAHAKNRETKTRCERKEGRYIIRNGMQLDSSSFSLSLITQGR